MSRPYFSVGEEIILCSKNRPDLNGERVVLEIFHTVKESIKFHKRFRPDVFWEDRNIKFPAYALSDIPKSTNGVPPLWVQSALRKKPKLSDFSFEELIGIEEGIPA